MPTRDPPPTTRINHCYFCGAVVPEHRNPDGSRASGRPPEYCPPPKGVRRSPCAEARDALDTLEQGLQDILRKMSQRARTGLRKQLWALANSVPQEGFNSPEWKARAKVAQAEKRRKTAALPPVQPPESSAA